MHDHEKWLSEGASSARGMKKHEHKAVDRADSPGIVPHADDPENAYEVPAEVAVWRRSASDHGALQPTAARRQCNSLQNSSRPSTSYPLVGSCQWTQGQTRSWLRRMMLEHGKTPGQSQRATRPSWCVLPTPRPGVRPGSRRRGPGWRHSQMKPAKAERVPVPPRQARQASSSTGLTANAADPDDETKKPSRLVRARKDGLQIEVTHTRPQAGGQDQRRCGPKSALSCSAGSKRPPRKPAPDDHDPAGCRRRTYLTEKALSVMTKPRAVSRGERVPILGARAACLRAPSSHRWRPRGSATPSPPTDSSRFVITDSAFSVKLRPGRRHPAGS